MRNADLQQISDTLITNEEVRLGVGSPEFMDRHREIMNQCDRQQELLRDLAMEQRETM